MALVTPATIPELSIHPFFVWKAAMSKLNCQLEMRDGRRLGYDERGAIHGIPILYFHGGPSSRIESNLFLPDKLLERLNVRLIAVDRPGMGLSDFQPDRRLLDWHQDVLTLADHLRIERFAILAYSLGGPYGAACAYAIPERLTRTGIVSGAALFTIPELVRNVNEGTRRFLYLPREKPRAARLFLWMLSMTARFAPGRLIAQAKSLLPEPDRKTVLSDPAVQADFIAMVREAFRQGARGAYHEALLGISNWGFGLDEIQSPLFLWHGEMDQNVPVQMARYLADAVPNCQAMFFPDEGHISLFKQNAEKIIRSLIE